MSSAGSAASDQPSNHAPSYLSDTPQEYESIPEDRDMTTSLKEIVTRQSSPRGRPRVGSPLRYTSPERRLVSSMRSNHAIKCNMMVMSLREAGASSHVPSV